MPDRDPYGIPVVQPPSVVVVHKDTDRGPDPRRIVAETIKMIAGWEKCDYSGMIDDVLAMTPDEEECAFCYEAECEPGCPLARWRGQS